MAGVGASYHFSCHHIKVTIVEKNSSHGGIASSFFSNKGFVFDNGPHVFCPKTERIKNLFFDSVDHQVECFHLRTNNYWKGYWIKHPVMLNLHGLPGSIVKKTITELREIKEEEESLAPNLKDWLYAVFGQTLAENFFLKYIQKHYTTSADNIEIQKMEPLFHRAGFNDVLFSFIKRKKENTPPPPWHYYPTAGGFVRFLDKFISKVPVTTGHQVISIDADKKILFFENGRIKKYDYLISSIPLPELIKMIIRVPHQIKSATAKLAYTSCILVNIGIDRKIFPKAHVTYFHDPDIIFSKLSFPHMFSPHNAPKGCETIQAEIHFSKKYRPLYLEAERFIDPTINSLLRSGLLLKSDNIIFKDARLISYGNIIYDFDQKPNTAIIHKYLDSLNIKYCGRLGEWDEKMADESFASGEEAAQKVIHEINANRQAGDPPPKFFHYTKNPED